MSSQFPGLCSAVSAAQLAPIICAAYTCITVKTKLCKVLNWLPQLRDYHSCANSKNLVHVKHFVGGKSIQYQLPLHEQSTNHISLIKQAYTAKNTWLK